MIHSDVPSLRRGMRQVLLKFNERTNRDVHLGIRKLHERIVNRTPEDTGQTAASWYMSDRGELGKVQPPGNYSAPINSAIAMSKLPAKVLGKTITIANHIPWIPKLEFGGYPGGGPRTTPDGFSTQAPRGMARISIIQSYEEWLRGQF